MVLWKVMMAESKWIFFELICKGGRTSSWYVIARKNEAVLGEIKWFGKWRQYAFFPVIGTVYNPDCMDHISEFIRGEMTRRKEWLRKHKVKHKVDDDG